MGRERELFLIGYSPQMVDSWRWVILPDPTFMTGMWIDYLPTWIPQAQWSSWDIIEANHQAGGYLSMMAMRVPNHSVLFDFDLFHCSDVRNRVQTCCNQCFFKPFGCSGVHVIIDCRPTYSSYHHLQSYTPGIQFGMEFTYFHQGAFSAAITGTLWNLPVCRLFAHIKHE